MNAFAKPNLFGSSALVALLFWGSHALASSIMSSTAAPDVIPKPVRAAMPDARALGKGSLRLLGFKIYDAQLFASSGFAQDPGWANRAFALELKYSRAIKASDIVKSSVDEIDRLNLGTAEQRLAWAAAMSKTFINVNSGDRLTGIHQPRQETRFYLNDQLLGTIEDSEFGKAFFSIWLSNETRDKALRAALLNAATR